VTDTPIDPLSGPAFETLWTDQIAPKLKLLEADRKRAMRGALLIWFGFLLLIGVEAALTGWLSDGRDWKPSDWVLYPTLAVGFLVGLMPLNRVALATRARLLESLTAPMGVAYTAKPATLPAFARLQQLGLLPKEKAVAFLDLLQGRRGGAQFSVCTAQFTAAAVGTAQRSDFVGQIFAIAFPRRFEGTTIVLREDGWRVQFEAPKGLEPVGLEASRFETAFAVFSDDQVAARALLTPTFMEQLAALETAFAGRHLRCAFWEGEFIAVIEGGLRFAGLSMFERIDERIRADRMAADLRAVLALTDAIQAATR